MSAPIRSSDLVQASLLGATNWLRDVLATEFQNRILNTWDGTLDAFRHCDSPLEGAFLVWWEAYLFNPSVAKHCPFDLVPQWTVMCQGRQYRLDFAVVDKVTRQPVVAVELDGHQWHSEKTREDAAYRNRRDRDLQALGFPVFHYTYTEFVDDTIGCVAEVYGRALLESMSTRIATEKEIA